MALYCKLSFRMYILTLPLQLDGKLFEDNKRWYFTSIFLLKPLKFAQCQWKPILKDVYINNNS